ncbi:predicted protein [Uncinocarpus reesii 1704]|uniref:DUF1765-domain-containing protein n=1 Tax=Uncinocarpus reesii (strain UAMH 1704) TaxID=336963 RepID=C4JYZ5_UNCRE|nr:uncharacterized protein UREG_07396 [Uncinocarpus reesii 1704]EEP82531.1 predicted protein [Uncinocarpus reesii 1704]
MPPSTNDGSDGGSSSQLTRSASYNYIPALIPDGDGTLMRKTLSEVNLTHSTDQQTHSQKTEDFATGKEILRQSSLRSKRKNGSTFTLGDDDGNRASMANGGSARTTESTDRSRKTKTVAGALASLTRKPWKTSRSPSPSQSNKDMIRRLGRSNGQISPAEIETAIHDNTLTEPVKDSGKYKANDPARTTAVLTKRNKRPLSVTAAKDQNDKPPSVSRSPSIRSLRRKSSLERLAASVGLSRQDIPPIPQNSPPEVTKLKPEQPRKRDELWNVFRGLDADFQKYQSKSSSLKVNVIRSSLLPCLSRYANHPSNAQLRPEDLDRRVNILNKWWTGLLETLSGRTSNSITGVDRPVYLEAITAIMMRPEWRAPTSPSSPGATPTQKSDFTRKSNTSLESTGSDFLVDSIHHNVRNILSQNLLSQLSYCIDKMSTRHTPASLVSFAGKSCAYAFFFCRDVCDLLVRLWNIGPELIRRVISQFKSEGNLSTRNAMSEQIASHFPPVVRGLSFTSHAALVRNMRRNASVPLAASNINWFGPWVSRWCGRDTDLFFVFVKHFHILVAEFLPAGTDFTKRIYVPGLVPVHAQMLVVLESTLSKQSNPQIPDNINGPATTTFEDFIDGAEATATGFPLGATNSLRIMSENRLILILKHILLDNSVPSDTKQFFLETFCGILKLAARKTSLFDHGPCFVLCDFVEELLPIIPPYCKSTGQADILDWDFWLEVCKQMMKSRNVVTEVRAFAFIFAAWDAINGVELRKELLCLGMLLQEKLFYHYFSHWSPMIRSYFHRLICWRLARLNENPSALDRRIYNTLSSRLSEIWSYFLSYQSKAEKQLTAPLSAVPSQPQTKKRWKVLRSIFGNGSNPKPGEIYLQSTRNVAISSSDSGSGSVSRSISDTSSVLESDTDYMEDVSNAPTTATSPPIVGSGSTKEMPFAPFQCPSNNYSFSSKYAGRALAEWSLVVSECDCFFQRRRDEGVPYDNLVEIPMLGVESFRK